MMALCRSAPPQRTMSLVPVTQLLDRDVDGRERRGARGVDRVVDAAEVEPVGDAAAITLASTPGKESSVSVGSASR